MARKKPKIISIANMKGGVGKSATSLAFASLLSRKNKILLIDMDTQASITSYYKDQIREHNVDLRIINIYEVLKNNLNIEDSIINVGKNIDLIPSYLSLHKINDDRIDSKELLLKSNLDCFDSNYKYIILDTTPSFDFTYKNSLLSSSHIIVPLVPEKWAIECLDLFYYFFNILELKIPVFILATRFKNNNTHKEYVDLIKEKENFLGIISEREDLNRNIASNSVFSSSRDYMREYENAVNNFLNTF
ncbi:ATPase, para family protein [Borrelia duttonii CR2A]|uniref:ATPase, para family protein n=1 Tax=Borrelia duttonii CR2A TaxID=1432657 RepID=W6TEZ2_9SPIR|nr:ParA family protein [Borrelia duttonii]ETZ17202.1 ATPase, para family protein [Borrelia duttonii CR2A]